MRHVTLAARRAQQYLRRRRIRPGCGRWSASAPACSDSASPSGRPAGSWTAASRNAWDGVNRPACGLVGQAGLVVRDVYVEGRRRTPAEALRTQLGIAVGMPLLALDTAATKERLEQLAWVEQASVARMLPDAVHIRLLERQPLALWQHDGRFDVIDRAGAVIESALNVRQEEYRHLRVVVGEGAPAVGRRACSPFCRPSLLCLGVWSPPRGSASGAGTCISTTGSRCGCRNRMRSAPGVCSRRRRATKRCSSGQSR